QARRAAFVSNAQCSLGNDILQQVWFVLSDFRKDLLQRCKSRLEHGDLEVCNSIGDQLRFENFIVEWTAVPRDDRPCRSGQRHQSSGRSLRYGWRGPVFGSRCWSREGDRLLHLHPPNLSIRVTQETGRDIEPEIANLFVPVRGFDRLVNQGNLKFLPFQPEVAS